MPFSAILPRHPHVPGYQYDGSDKWVHGLRYWRRITGVTPDNNRYHFQPSCTQVCMAAPGRSLSAGNPVSQSNESNQTPVIPPCVSPPIKRPRTESDASFWGVFFDRRFILEMVDAREGFQLKVHGCGFLRTVPRPHSIQRTGTSRPVADLSAKISKF